MTWPITHHRRRWFEARIVFRIALRLVSRVALLSASACTTWHPARPLEHTSDVDTVARARVTWRDGSRIELRDVVVRADSVLGRSGETAARIALARAQITTIETRAVSTLRTVSLVVGVAAVVTVFAIGKAISELSSDIH